MAGINFDATQVAPNFGFSPVEPGKYIVSLVKSDFEPTANGAGVKLVLHALVNGGAFHGRNIIFSINWENPSAKCVEIGRGQFSALCHAVNVMKPQDTMQMHNIPFELEVSVTPDGKYNNVEGINPVSHQAQPMPQPVQQYQAAPVQQYQPQPQFNPQPQQAFVPQAQPVQQYQQPMAQPTGLVNPMAQYEQMAQPQPMHQAPAGPYATVNPPQQQQPQPQMQAQAEPQVPDWIKNQQLAQQQAAPMGNG